MAYRKRHRRLRRTRRLSRRSSRRRFRNAAKRVHPKNLRKVIARGGFML